MPLGGYGGGAGGEGPARVDSRATVAGDPLHGLKARLLRLPVGVHSAEPRGDDCQTGTAY